MKKAKSQERITIIFDEEYTNKLTSTNNSNNPQQNNRNQRKVNKPIGQTEKEENMSNPKHKNTANVEMNKSKKFIESISKGKLLVSKEDKDHNKMDVNNMEKDDKDNDKIDTNQIFHWKPEFCEHNVQFKCGDNEESIPYTLVCDNIEQCSGGKDEKFCDFPQCYEFQCGNTQCISKGK